MENIEERDASFIYRLPAYGVSTQTQDRLSRPSPHRGWWEHDPIKPQSNSLWWYSLAACTDYDREMFLCPANKWDAQRAKRICEGCPVQEVCLYHGLSMEIGGHRHGVFGAMTSLERDRTFNGTDRELHHRHYLDAKAELERSSASTQAQGT